MDYISHFVVFASKNKGYFSIHIFLPLTTLIVSKSGYDRVPYEPMHFMVPAQSSLFSENHLTSSLTRKSIRKCFKQKYVIPFNINFERIFTRIVYLFKINRKSIY